MSHAPRERVSWNYKPSLPQIKKEGHAPRERVSWNAKELAEYADVTVTLHVSVWVEIHYRHYD